MAKIIIPTPLRKFTNGQSIFETEASNVKEAISNLVNNYNEVGPNILDSNGNIRSFIRVYLGDEDINELQGDTTAIATNDTISIVPAIAGGVF